MAIRSAVTRRSRKTWPGSSLSARSDGSPVRKGSSPSRKSTSRSLRRQLTHRNAWAVVGAAITALIAYWNTRLSTSVGGLITAVVLLGIGIMILMQDPRRAPRRLRSSGLLRLPYRCLASLVCIMLAVFLVVRSLPAMAQGPLPAFDVEDAGVDAAEWVGSAASKPTSFTSKAGSGP